MGLPLIIKPNERDLRQCFSQTPEATINTGMSDTTAAIMALVAEVRLFDLQGHTDDEIASWLKARTADFGESVAVLARAREVSSADAMASLKATDTWQRVETRFHIFGTNGEYDGELRSPNGKTFSVGGDLKLPGGTCRVLAVDASDSPSITARLSVEWQAPRRAE